MKFTLNNTICYTIGLFLFSYLIVSCSAERKNAVSKAFHNTTARYNAYYYAKERIKEIKGIVEEGNENDYNNILKIYPKVDTVIASSYSDQIDDCVKKASIAIQRHKNSKWVDDSYILVGLARHYSVDYVNAIETFKFVNTKSEDDDARHEALTHLMKTFTDYEEFNNAVAVSDFLKKEKLSKDNQKTLYLNRAHYYQVKEDYNAMVKNLVLAAPLLKKKDGKSRIYFIIGQVYQQLGFDSEAYNHYKKCLSSNPDYELSFYAKLNMAQVTELSNTSDVKTARKLFKKLLSDKKNKEFKDKIYYEMAEFEMKQGSLDKAIEYYNASVKSSTNNEIQKGQSFLKLGMLYYDSLKKYELAKAYYDSTVSFLPKDYKGYEEIKERQGILEDFVTQLNVIQVQDSLLALAELDSSGQMEVINQFLDEKEAREKEAAEKAKRKMSNTNFQSPFDPNQGGSGTGTWYFGNSSAVSLGVSEFKRKWGNRELEDNWRRSSKASDSGSLSDVAQDGENGQSGDPNTVEQNPEEIRNAEAMAMLKTIPSTDEQKKLALGKVEVAHYNLGKIYNFELKEKENASSTFVTLLDRFPSSEYEPEVLYLLYLINKDFGKEEKYKNEIISKYPYTTYAKLLINPNYTEESTATNEQLKKIYKSAYGHYEAGRYDSARNIIYKALDTYDETTFTPNLKLLDILIIGQTESDSKYKFELNKFIEENPNSDIAPYATILMKAAEEFETNLAKRQGAQYINYFEQEHYFVLVYDTKENLADKLSPKIEAFNDLSFSDAKLSTSNLVLNSQYTIVLVSKFDGVRSSLTYFDKFIEQQVSDGVSITAKMHKFVIAKDNFNIFYQTGDLKNYLKFFEKHYQNGN